MDILGGDFSASLAGADRETTKPRPSTAKLGKLQRAKVIFNIAILIIGSTIVLGSLGPDKALEGFGCLESPG